jgi:hypothetical protein
MRVAIVGSGGVGGYYRDGTIALAFVDVDYRNRLEPTEILSVLQTLSQGSRESL